MRMSGPDYHNANIPVSNSGFLDVLGCAAPVDAWLWTTAFIGNPDGHPGWHGSPYDGTPHARAVVDSYGRQNTYFSTAALFEQDELVQEKGVTSTRRVVRRRKKHFARLLALVVDDANPDDLLAPPSWVLNTSPGRKQVGFFLDGDDPDCADIQLVDVLVTRMATMGLIGGDRSGNNAVRYVRLPQGENQKPRPTGHFTVNLAKWDPETRYSLADAAAALEINLDELRVIAATPGHQVSAGSIQGEQDDKLNQATQNIISGSDLHDSINILAASLIASGTHPGAIVNTIRALMNNSRAPRDERWTARYNDIPRSVDTAFQKFGQPGISLPDTTTIDPDTGEILREPLFRKAGSLLTNLKPVQYVVDGYLETDAISMIFGPSGSGKSFIALAFACSVASGTAWFGMPVKQGPVFVIIGEGLNGYARRIAAWSKQYQVNLTEAPLYISRRAIQLSNQAAALELAAEIDQMSRDTGVQPALVIVDTVARNFGDGDENSTKDMSAFVANIDLYLKNRYKANIMLVHHTGHDGERARGSSALKAALDQEFRVSGVSGRPRFECTKMKDAEVPLERTFKITGVTLGTDADGIDITGAVIVSDGSPLEFQVGSRSDGKAITAGDIVKMIIDHVKGYEQLAIALQCGAKAARTATEKTQQAGLLEKRGRWFTLSADGLKQACACCWVTSDWQPL